MSVFIKVSKAAFQAIALDRPPTEGIPPIVPGPSSDNWTYTFNQPTKLLNRFRIPVDATILFYILFFTQNKFYK